VISGAVYTLPFDMLADLTPVAPLPSVPYWMTARKTLPANNLKELAEWLKHNNASASTVGTASLARFCGMAFQKASGTDFQFVPYRGGAPALQDLVAGNIDLNCDLASNSLAQYRNGNIKVFAVMADTRWAPAPEVPTTDEAGFPGIHISTWLGLWAPKNTPADIVAKVNAAALAAMADPDAHKRIADLGMQVPPPQRSTPAAFAAFHRAEVEKWYPIVKAAGIKAE
jgi:tripartite-type tricarboxylate transporter receptor subunit TctC